MLNKISINVAEAIPYRNFKEKIQIVLEEISKGRYVEIMDELKIIYSAEKWEEIWLGTGKINQDTMIL